MSPAEANPIELFPLAIFFLIVIIPTLVINRFVLKIRNSLKLLTSFGRMAIQLLLVGLYLTKIFDLNNPWLNIGYLILMIVAASAAAIKNSSLKLKYFLPQLFIAMILPLAGVMVFLILVLTRPTPLFSARYIIPMGGMLLGNSLNSNIIILRTFFKSVKDNENLYQQRLMLGANRHEALRPWTLDSIKNALAPITATMANMGLVSLPGMMTGQLLQGANPSTAVLYQIAIVIGIFGVQYASILLTISFSIRFQFKGNDSLKEGLFSKKQ